MEYLTFLLSYVAVYGGAYAAALATASSFYAVFFFFWTRTGERKNSIDITTKKVYLHAIYTTLRLSLGVMLVAKLLEGFIVTKELQASGLDISFFDVLISHNMLLILGFMVLLALNTALMMRRAINFSYALPFAIVTYFFLFLHMTARARFSSAEGFVYPSGEIILTDLAVYIAGLFVGTIVFNYFAKKVK